MSFPRQLNPDETVAFITDFERLPAEHQADECLIWRERAVACAQALLSPKGMFVGAVGATAGAALMGVLRADGEYKAAQLVQDWQDAGATAVGLDPAIHPTPFKTVVDEQGIIVHQAAKDPRKPWGAGPANKETYVMVATGAVALGSTAYYPAHRVARDTFFSCWGFYAGSKAADAAYDRMVEKGAAA
jgi:hypothetical protein